MVPLTGHLGASGWSVHAAPLVSANGYTDPETRKVTLAQHLAPAQAAKTLLPESAHIDLGHIDDIAEHRAHRGQMEVEAESVAFIVAGLLGFDTSAYSIGYIAGWADEDIAVIRDTAARVLKAAQAIAYIIEHYD